MTKTSLEHICLVDNATLNQCALALGRHYATLGQQENVSFRNVLLEDPMQTFEAAPEAFVASVASFVQSLVLYDNIYVLSHTDHPSAWEYYDLHDEIERRVNPFNLSDVEESAAQHLAIERLRVLARTDGFVSEYVALLRKLGAFQLRKTPLKAPTKQSSYNDRYSVSNNEMLVIRSDLEEIFERLQQRIVGKNKKGKGTVNTAEIDESLSYSLFYWLYYRGLFYNAVAEVFNGRSHYREVVHVPALVRSQHARLFLNRDQKILELVERVVRNCEAKAVKQLRENDPDLPLVQLDLPPIFAYVLDKASTPSEILNRASDIKHSDSNIRALRSHLNELRNCLNSDPSSIKSLTNEINAISLATMQRWKIKSNQLVEHISLAFDKSGLSVNVDFLPKEIVSMINAARRRSTVNVLSSFRLAISNVNSLGALYDKHFWLKADLIKPRDSDQNKIWYKDLKSEKARRRQKRKHDMLSVDEDASNAKTDAMHAQMAKEFDKDGPVIGPEDISKDKDAHWQPKNAWIETPQDRETAAALAAIKASWAS